MPWVYLIAAGLLEVGWAIGLKQTHGFTRLWPSVFTVLAMIASFALLSLALKSIPIGTGYAVWTGIGAVGAAILGMAFFGEPATAARMFFLALIVTGIVGLKFATPLAEEKEAERSESAGPRVEASTKEDSGA